MKKPIGVIGAGKFGIAVANLLAKNCNVLLYTRKQSVENNINQHHICRDYKMNSAISATTDLASIAKSCEVIFPIIPSANIVDLMKNFGPMLRPYHILIHGIKGLLVDKDRLENEDIKLDVSCVKTVSDIIQENSLVRRVGCLSGPNLSKEILEGQPTTTVVASDYDEVIRIGQKILASNKFYVFGNNDIIGAELAGALKNIIAIASGIIAGLGLGKNMQGALLARGLREMILIGKLKGSNAKAFIGTAGIGDLITTATSTKSRNFTFGGHIAAGKTRTEALEAMQETVEGIGTLRVARRLVATYNLHAPITKGLYDVVYNGISTTETLENIFRYPQGEDVDFFEFD